MHDVFCLSFSLGASPSSDGVHLRLPRLLSAPTSLMDLVQLLFHDSVSIDETYDGIAFIGFYHRITCHSQLLKFHMVRDI